MDYNEFLTMTTILGMLLVGGVWWWFIGVPAYQRFKDRTTLLFILIGSIAVGAVEGGVIGFMIGAIILA